MIRTCGLVLALSFMVAACGTATPAIRPPVLAKAPKPFGPLERYHLPAVYFDAGRSDVSASQKAYLREMGLAFLDAGVTKLLLTGHGDVSEGRRSTQRLSLRRAESVGMELVQLGYRREDLRIVGVGATQPRVADPERREADFERFVLIQGRD